MKRLFLFFLLMIALGACSTPIERETSASPELQALADHAYDLRTNTPDSARSLALQVIESAKKTPDTYAESIAWNVLGILEKNKGAYDVAEGHFKKSLELREARGIPEDIASACNNLGQLFKNNENDYRKAEEYFVKGLEVLPSNEISKIKGTLLNNYGEVLRQMGETEKAEDILRQGLAIRRNLGDSTGIAFSLLNLGLVFEEMANYQGLETYLLEAYGIFFRLNNDEGKAKSLILLGNAAFHQGKWDEAEEAYRQALDLETWMNANDQALIYRNLGSVCMRTKHYPEAAEHYAKCQELFSGLKNKQELNSLTYEWGNWHFEQSRYDSAVAHYENGLAALQILPNARLEGLLLLQLSSAHARLARYDAALLYSDRYAQLADSLARHDQGFLNYQSNMREKDLKLEQHKRQADRNLGLLLLAGLFLLFLVAVLYALLNRSKLRIAEQDAQIAYQRVDEVLLTKELDANYARQEGQDAERERIAKELHDRIGGMLTAVKLNLSDLDKKIDALQLESREKYQKTQKLLGETYEEVRRLSHDLDSGILEKFGLKAQLESFADDLTTDKMQVELSVFGLEERLPRKMESQVCRIVQELAQNAANHAQAQLLSIQVNRFDGLLNIMVEDDGVGFDPVEALRKGGMGMKNLQARVNALGGIMEIDAATGKGTTIVIDIPVQTKILEKIQTP